MSNVWTFSPSSEPLLRRCLAAAALQESDNKWIEKFGRKSSKLLSKPGITEPETVQEVVEIVASPEKKEIKAAPVSYEEFFDAIESEVRFDYVIEECSKNHDLLTQMAQRLSTKAVRKIFDHIFSNKCTENSFVETFLPEYIKRQYSWLCIDILVELNQTFPEIFRKVLKILLKDSEVPNTALAGYVTTLSEKELTNFIETLLTIDLTSESFLNNLLTIHTAYKNCTKTERIQNYMKNSIIQYSKDCATDHKFGRLFLAYLQSEKALQRTVNVKQLEVCLDLHRSQFKRPCEMLLKEMVDTH